MVSIHKIFSPGMKFFKCDFNKCNFVTGSRMMFVRHNHSKFVQIGGSIVVVVVYSLFWSQSNMFNNQTTATKLLPFDTLLTILTNMLNPPALGVFET